MVVSHCGLTLHSPVTHDIKHLFMSLFAIVVCLWWHFCSNHLPTEGDGGVLELLLNFEMSLCIVGTNLFSNTCFSFHLLFVFTFF